MEMFDAIIRKHGQGDCSGIRSHVVKFIEAFKNSTSRELYRQYVIGLQVWKLNKVILLLPCAKRAMRTRQLVLEISYIIAKDLLGDRKESLAMKFVRGDKSMQGMFPLIVIMEAGDFTKSINKASVFDFDNITLNFIKNSEAGLAMRNYHDIKKYSELKTFLPGIEPEIKELVGIYEEVSLPFYERKRFVAILINCCWLLIGCLLGKVI